MYRGSGGEAGTLVETVQCHGHSFIHLRSNASVIINDDPLCNPQSLMYTQICLSAQYCARYAQSTEHTAERIAGDCLRVLSSVTVSPRKRTSRSGRSKCP